MPKINKTSNEWQEILTNEQYRITRKSGTEKAFTGPNWDNKDKGDYYCICCQEKLFNSDTKYDSGTGWPSFYKPANEQIISEYADNILFRKRNEVRCANCDAHLGHVFNDGPEPTGLRYCINGHALEFKKISSNDD